MGAWFVTRPLSEPSSLISVVALTPGSSRGLLPLISRSSPRWTWSSGRSCPRCSASPPPVCRLHAGRLPAEDRRSPRRWVLMLRQCAWNQRCIIFFCVRRLLPTANGHTRAHTWRVAAKWMFVIEKGRTDLKLFKHRSFQNAHYPSRTHACSAAPVETAPPSRAVHARLRTRKGNPFMLIMKTTGLSYSHSCRLKTGKSLLFKLKPN